MKTKKTKGGPVNRPPTTDKAQANLDALGELLSDVADSIREATVREQVLDNADPVDRSRFPSVGGAR